MLKKLEIWIPSLGQEDPLEEETATHSSIPAWKIPRAEEPGGLPSVGLQRVERDWAPEHGYTTSALSTRMYPAFQVHLSDPWSFVWLPQPQSSLLHELVKFHCLFCFTISTYNHFFILSFVFVI